MKTPLRPETYSPWVFLEFVLQNEKDLFVRRVTQEKDLDTGRMIDVVTLVAMSDLTPREYRYWTERWFLDATTRILTAQDWVILQEREDAQVSLF